MGGLSLAAESLGLQPLLGVDICASASQTYSKNFPAAKAILADIADPTVLDSCLKIRKKTKKLVIVSGPPCQGFSVAGRRTPNDPRNDVLISVANIIASVKPDAALVENVAALGKEKHSDKATKFENIIKSAGYNVERFELNSFEYGVPQKRRRLIYFICLNELDRKSINKNLLKLKKDGCTVEEAFKGLPVPAVRPLDRSTPINTDCSFPNHISMRHSDSVKKKIASISPGSGPLSYRRLHPKKPASTLISGHRAPPAHYSEPRSITVREAARLQGFPDSFIIYGSFSNQLQQVSNAVPPPVASAALSTIVQFIKSKR